MRNSRRLFVVIIAAALALSCGCAGAPIRVAGAGAPGSAGVDTITLSTVPPVPAITPEPTPEPTPVPTPALRGVRRYVIRAVGDIMCHDSQIEAAKHSELGYDFSPQFERIVPWLQNADLTIGNLETPLGSYDGPGSEYGGFPNFNAPPQLAAALRDAGFDAVGLANNHMLDQGVAGIGRTIAALDEAGIAHAGAYDTKDNSDNIRIIHLDSDMRVALLSYMHFSNGVHANSVKYYDVEAVKRDIIKAREQLADVVLVMVHWGSEYSRTPSRQAEADARALIQAGADAVIGHHPHVLQPAREIIVSDGENGSRKGVVTYSMGNFVSNQPFEYTQTGGILHLAFDKDLDTGETVLAETGFITTYVERGRSASGARTYTVWPVDATIADPPEGITSSCLRYLRQAAEQTRALFGEGSLSFLER